MIGNSTVKRKSAKLMTCTQSVVQTAAFGSSSANAGKAPAKGAIKNPLITDFKSKDFG